MSIAKPEIAPVWAEDHTSGDGDLARPADVAISDGFPLVPGTGPSRQSFNWILQHTDQGVRYLMTRGIPDWDTDEDQYVAGACVRDPADGGVYLLTGTATAALSPFSDYTNWAPVGTVDDVGLDDWRTGRVWEDWLGADLANHSSFSSGVLGGRWSYGIFGTGASGAVGAVGALNGLTKYPRGGCVSVSCFGATNPIASVIESAKPWARHHKSIMTFDQDFTINGSSEPLATSTTALGIGDGTLISGGLAGRWNDDFTPPVGFGVARLAGSSTWSVWANPPGGTYHDFTGPTIARDSVTRVKMLSIGRDASPDGKAHIKVYMSGSLIVDFYDGGPFAGTDFDMTASGGAFAHPFMRMSGNNGEVAEMVCGPIRFGQRFTNNHVRR